MYKSSRKPIGYLTHDEVRKLIDAIPADMRGRRDKAILETLFSTGMRISEIVALKADVFQVASRQKNEETATFEYPIVGKGGVQRVVFFSPASLKSIQLYLNVRTRKNDERLFPYKVRAIRYMVDRRAKQAGLEKHVSPHVLRHSFGTHLVSKGVNLFYVKEFMGHKSIHTTARYLHVSNKELKDLHARIHARLTDES